MPMKDVHFVHFHEVKGVQDGADGEEMAGRVDHQSSMAETWSINDDTGVHVVLKDIILSRTQNFMVNFMICPFYL